MEIIKYLLSKKVYILLNVIILILGYYFINKGISLIDMKSTNSNVYVSIGTSLIATGIVVFLDLWKKLTIKKVTSRIKNVINDAGVQWISKKRDLDRYDNLIENLKDSLDICGYSLGGFFDSFSDKIKEKAQRKNVKVRVLFVDPDSYSSAQRANIEGKSVQLFKEKLDAFRRFFDGINSIEIRKIEIPLSSMIYRIDDVMFIGPHFYKKQSKSTLTIEISKGQWLFSEYQEEFNRIWNDAKPI
jgi:hypothetical protein